MANDMVVYRPASTEIKTWQDRAVEATGGNSTQIGAILLAVLNRWPRTCPAFANNAAIMEDGRVVCAFKDKTGHLHPTLTVCMIDEFVSNFQGLADHLKLNDDDRMAMFVELQKWFFVDFRAAGKAYLGK